MTSGEAAAGHVARQAGARRHSQLLPEQLLVGLLLWLQVRPAP